MSAAGPYVGSGCHLALSPCLPGGGRFTGHGKLAEIYLQAVDNCTKNRILYSRYGGNSVKKQFAQCVSCGVTTTAAVHQGDENRTKGRGVNDNGVGFSLT